MITHPGHSLDPQVRPVHSSCRPCSLVDHPLFCPFSPAARRVPETDQRVSLSCPPPRTAPTSARALHPPSSPRVRPCSTSRSPDVSAPLGAVLPQDSGPAFLLDDGDFPEVSITSFLSLGPQFSNHTCKEPSSDHRPRPLPSVLLPFHSLRSCPHSFWPPFCTESKPHGGGGRWGASRASCSGGENFGVAGLVCVSLSVTRITQGHWGERSR